MQFLCPVETCNRVLFSVSYFPNSKYSAILKWFYCQHCDIMYHLDYKAEDTAGKITYENARVVQINKN